MPGVDVVRRETSFAADRFGVRGGEFVMRKDQIAAAALDVQPAADAAERDRRALDVPARPAGPERRGPARLARSFGTPQQRVELVGFARPVRVAAAFGEQRQHGVAVVAGLVAELQRGVGAVVDVGEFGVVDDVGGPRSQHLLDQLDHLGDRLGCRHVFARRQHPQRGHVVAVQRHFAGRKVAPVDAVAVGPLEERIVDVGDVLHVMHVVSEVSPQPVNQIERQIGGGVTEMGGVVGRDPADVHGGRRPGRDRAHLAVGGVVQPQLRAASRAAPVSVRRARIAYRRL